MVVFKNLRLIDGTGRGPATNMAIVVENGVFLKVCPAGSADAEKAAAVVDLEGRTVIPGLSDAHTHFSGSSDFDRPGFGKRQETYDYVEARDGFLDWGVTTVRSCGDIGPEILSFCQDTGMDSAVSPRVLPVGPWFQAAKGHPAFTVGVQVGLHDPETLRRAAIVLEDGMDVEAEVERICAMGVHEIKAFLGHVDKGNYPVPVPHMTQEQLSRITRRAHELGKRVICHVDDPLEMEQAVLAGVDGVEHMLANGAEHTEFSNELLDLLIERKTVVDPTMISILRWDDQVPKANPVFPALQKAVRQFYQAGVRLAVGCDSGIPFVPFGESLHDEMKCLAEAGIPPLEVLRMATLGNAEIFQMADSIGSIEPGKRADFLVLDDDPLANIENTKKIRLVVKDGRIIRDRLFA